MFWHRKTSYEGLSSRTILWRAFSQIVIFLYLLDEDASMLLVVPTGLSVLVELWKCKKIHKLELSLRGRFIRRKRIETNLTIGKATKNENSQSDQLKEKKDCKLKNEKDCEMKHNKDCNVNKTIDDGKDNKSNDEKDSSDNFSEDDNNSKEILQQSPHLSNEEITEQFDRQGMRYLSYLLYPICIGGAIYSLLYQPHRSFYSWTLNSLVNGVYAFGFLFMLPQLFVNYKLKSVSALPWRVFMYSAFNTFIDDFFAFLIKMPTAHRVACLRDDVVFIIYLYQRWLYPIDKSRKDVAINIVESLDAIDDHIVPRSNSKRAEHTQKSSSNKVEKKND